MAYEFTLTIELSASPDQVFDAWLSSEKHTAMTGGVAHVDPAIGGAFDAWDGYITGETLELESGRRIRQTWRTSHFAPNDPDSTIDVELEPVGDSTLLTLTHSNVPEGQTGYEESGWQQYYFEPMKRRFQWLRYKATM